MQQYLKYVPGFRSGTKWKMILASIYYVFSILMMFGGIGVGIFSLGLPLLVTSLIDVFKHKKRSKEKIVSVIMAIIIIFIGGSLVPKQATVGKTTSSTSAVSSAANQTKKDTGVKATTDTKAETKDTSATNSVNGQLKVHYINVGQGDSILVQQGNQNMLIDTGTNESTSTLMSYLQSQNIKKIDVLVLTHPHEDHIGGADAVIKGFDIGTIYMPKIETTTKTFEDVINAMKSKNLKATAPNPGDNFKLGDAACTVFGPINSNKEDLNTYSIVIKLVFGNNKFLFTGDAQASNEMDMIKKGFDLKADVLKVGHHGSHTSTCANFLSAVSPKYAVISVGKDNKYGHPTQSVMDRLKGAGVQVYRTDECGTIVATSDGKDIKFSTQPGSYNGASNKETANNNSSSEKKSTSSDNNSNSSSNTSSNSSNSSSGSSSSSSTTNEPAKGDRIVYWTAAGKSYHYDRNCKHLKRSKNVLEGPASTCPKTDPCDDCVK